MAESGSEKTELGGFEELIAHIHENCMRSHFNREVIEFLLDEIPELREKFDFEAMRQLALDRLDEQFDRVRAEVAKLRGKKTMYIVERTQDFQSQTDQLVVVRRNAAWEHVKDCKSDLEVMDARKGDIGNHAIEGVDPTYEPIPVTTEDGFFVYRVRERGVVDEPE